MAVTAEEQQARYAFGSALAHVRASRGLSQTELRDRLVAHGFKVSVGGVGMWETGKSAPGLTAVRAIETVLSTPGLGLVLGLDAGVLESHEERLADLERRLAAIEGATSDGLVGELRVAAYEGGSAHEARSPTDVRDRPRPPAVEPEMDEDDPGWDS